MIDEEAFKEAGARIINSCALCCVNGALYHEVKKTHPNIKPFNVNKFADDISKAVVDLCVAKYGHVKFQQKPFVRRMDSLSDSLGMNPENAWQIVADFYREPEPTSKRRAA